MSYPTIQTIVAAHTRIKPAIFNTPILTNAQLNAVSNAQLYFKCESLQKTGSFKCRGATNAVMQLAETGQATCVTTHSSGNHGAAVAMAAQAANLEAIIVVPNNAPAIKRANIERYGAKIVTCEPTYAAREATAQQVVQSHGAVFIHSNSDARVIAGQGTAALEMLEAVPTLDVIIAPVGGGGLLSGTALAVKTSNPTVQVIGAEPEQADDAFRSLKAGKIMPNQPNTIADGLRVPIGEMPFGLIQQHVDEIITVSEQQIVTAMRTLWDQLKLVVEPSAAVAYAVLLNRPKQFAHLRIGIILSGGNVDLDALPWPR